ncbi:MAG: hypothetical protein LC808_21330 [Actinobacteria bacterium]|nr:hypothetical protein [Actinomycetota bacterium]
MTTRVTEWLALRRVHEGGLTKLSGHYLNCGRPVGGFLAEMIDELVSAGFLALGRSSPTGRQQVCVTHPGQARPRPIPPPPEPEQA